MFIIFGLVGLVLPFLQGILFLAIGFILLSLWSPRIREYMDRPYDTLSQGPQGNPRCRGMGRPLDWRTL